MVHVMIITHCSIVDWKIADILESNGCKIEEW